MDKSPIGQIAESISFRQLRLFESVGRLSSVRRGSEDCNLSQPAVTQAIRKMERQLSEPLFERRANGSYLTPMGQIFHRRVQSFIRQFEDALIDLGVGGTNATISGIASRISRSQVRGLITIVEHGSFAKAADALKLTQASLQRAARDLEGNVRRDIYYRTAAGVMVTPKGVELGRRLRLATQEIEWGIRDMRAAHGIEESQLTIGALPVGGSMLLATVLDGFANEHPAAEIRIVTEGASEMVKRLRAGDVDMLIGIVQDTTAEDLTNESLAKTPYRIVCSRGHPLASTGELSKADLTTYDWVIGTEGSSRRQAFESLFSDVIRPRAAIATSSLPIVRHLLKSSDRLALMTEYELVHENSDFVALEFDEITPCPAIGVTLRAGWEPTRLHRSFVEQLRATVNGPVAMAAE